MHIVIIGNGISGITTAREIRKRLSDSISVISSESKHFFSRTALMYIYMGHMKFEHTKPYEDWFWVKNKIDLLHKQVLEVRFADKTLTFSDGSSLAYDKLVLAVGSVPNKFGWPGQDARRVQGLYSKQDLDMLEGYSSEIETAVIVGGGLIGVELAEMLLSRGKKVIFWFGKPLLEVGATAGRIELIGEHMARHHVSLRFSTELKEVLTGKDGSAIGVKTQNDELIDCQFVGLTVGVRPNIDFLRNAALETDKGILVNEYLETNVPDVYAVGDCVQHRKPPHGRKPLEQIWYTGRQMAKLLRKPFAESLPYTIRESFSTQPILDIEYQTYGFVPAVPAENQESFIWKHPTENKLVRINFDQADRAVLGVNCFGIRMRHTVWEHWLAARTPIDEVLPKLATANFDPEFFVRHEQDILNAFNRVYGKIYAVSL